MKDEIKEILNEIGYHQNIHENLTLSTKELDILVDCIINLQEEINKLTAESTEWESKYYDLQEQLHKASLDIQG